MLLAQVWTIQGLFLLISLWVSPKIMKLENFSQKETSLLELGLTLGYIQLAVSCLLSSFLLPWLLTFNFSFLFNTTVRVCGRGLLASIAETISRRC